MSPPRLDSAEREDARIVRYVTAAVFGGGAIVGAIIVWVISR